METDVKSFEKIAGGIAEQKGSTKKQFNDLCERNKAIQRSRRRIAAAEARIKSEKVKMIEAETAARRLVSKQKARLLAVCTQVASVIGNQRELIGRRKEHMWLRVVAKDRRVLREQFNRLARRRGLAI